WALSRRNPRGCMVGTSHGPEGARYSSHHDDTRMVRTSTSTPYWRTLSRENIALMSDLTGDGEPRLLQKLPVMYRFVDPDAPRGLVPATLYRDRFQWQDELGGIIDPER